MNIRFAILITVALALTGNNTVLAQDETLGRLFYTTKQRAALDANIRSMTKAIEKPAPIPPSVTVNGVVTRSDGERTIWIDGRAYHRANTGDINVTTRPADPGVVDLKVQGIRQKLPVRVGQRLDPTSGKTFEPYEIPTPSAQAPER
jgi:hypothetical protein